MAERLILKDTKLVRLTKYPGEDGTTFVLSVRALLTRTLASQLKCRNLCFAENDMPRRFGTIKLDEKIENCAVVIGGGELMATSVSHFAIGRPKEASETDASLEIACNLHFAGNAPLDAWFDNMNKGQFEMAMRPPNDWSAQGELFPDNAEEEDGEAGAGNPVEAKAERVDEGGQEPITEHLRGDALEQHEETAGALSSAREAGGGTPFRKGRKRTRGEQTETEAPAVQPGEDGGEVGITETVN